MSGRELTDKDYIRNIVQSEIRHSTPSIGVVTSVYEPGSDGPEGNYEVDVDVLGSGYPTSVEGTGDPEFSPQTHDAVPVTVPMSGVTTGLQVGSMVLIQYLNANSEAPLVTDVIYTEDNQAPITNEGEFRIRLGDGAVIEVVKGDNGGRELNIGHQPEDHQGIETGLSMNLNDGGFSLQDGSENGLLFDGEGNGILRWESMAMPWGAAGPVNWEGTTNVGGWDNIQSYSLTMTVEDGSGNPVEGATVSVERTGDAPDSGTGSGTGSGDGSGGSGTGSTTDQIESAIHSRTNEYRQQEDLSALGTLDTVTAVARQHSENMANQDFFAHEDSDGDNGGDRLRGAGIEVESWVENLAQQTGSSVTEDDPQTIGTAIVDGWIESDEHRPKLESENENEGIGVYINESGETPSLYATQVIVTLSSTN